MTLDHFVDIHTHTHFSLCGIHTHLEIIEAARERGLPGVAITDHGLELGGELRGSFYRRFPQTYKGVRVLKGIEANIMPGGTDMSDWLLPHTDIVLAGLHLGGSNMDVEVNTHLVIRAIETCPYMDVITHPFIRTFPLDFPRVVPVAAEAGVCLELNNATFMLGRGDVEVARGMLGLCRRQGCRIALGSDAHAITEVGEIAFVTGMLNRISFPPELVVNRDLDSTLAWLESRRALKKVS